MHAVSPRNSKFALLQSHVVSKFDESATSGHLRPAGIIRPAPPPLIAPPPSQPTTTFDFSNGIAASIGWSTGGGDPATSPYAFRKNEGSTWTANTGPSAGVGGSGSYVYAETSSPRVQGDLFTLTYDGSA